MTTIFPRLPNGLTICLSTTLCASVVALQNAESFAGKLEQVVYDVSEWAAAAAEAPDWLRMAGSITQAGLLNELEQNAIHRVALVLSPELQEEEPAAEEVIPTTAPRQQELPAVADAAVAAAEEAPAEAPAAEEPPPAQPELTESPSEALPAPQSRWWGLLSQPLRTPHTLVGGLHDTAPYAVTLVVRPVAEAQVVAEEQPAAEPQAMAEEQPAAEPQAVAEEQPVAEPQAVAEEQPAEPQAVAEEQPVAEKAGGEKKPEPPEEPGSPQAGPAALAAAGLASQAQELNAAAEAPPMRCRIMMVGDSLMEDLGPLMHRNMSKRYGLEFVISAKFSTGLCRPDRFNWAAHMREQVAKRPPDLVVFFMGANDGMPIKEGRRFVPTGGQEWKEAYKRKIDELVSIAREAGADVIWVEMPAVGGAYNKQLHANQVAQREYCEEHGITTLRTDPLFSGEWGRFEPYGTYNGKTVRLRSKDVTHLTAAGNAKLYDHLKPIVEQRLLAFYRAHPERRLSADELSRIRKVPVVYTCKYSAPDPSKAAKPVAPHPPRQ